MNGRQKVETAYDAVLNIVLRTMVNKDSFEAVV